MAAAQSDAVVIELNFETATGEAPAGGVAILDLNTALEYRNAGVALGEPIEVTGASGVTSRLQIRRSDLQPSAISCEGAQDAATVAGTRGVTLAITPDADRVVCTVSLNDELPRTGISRTLVALSANLLGAGALLLIVSRRTRD